MSNQSKSQEPTESSVVQNLKTERVHCNKCLGQTKHDVVASRSQTDTEVIEDEYSYNEITGTITYTMLECRGCGTVTLRRRIICDDMDVDSTDFFPPSISRQLPKWCSDLPSQFSQLLRETYTALHADSRRLAVMGARALVDLFMTRTLGDVGGFTVKMNRLVAEGYLSVQERGVLETALDAGHAVIHRGHIPKPEDVNTVFDIVENLLQQLALKAKVADLKKRTPARKKA